MSWLRILTIVVYLWLGIMFAAAYLSMDREPPRIIEKEKLICASIVFLWAPIGLFLVLAAGLEVIFYDIPLWLSRMGRKKGE